MIEKGKTYTGGCLCGAVRYVVDGPSVFESHCCCVDCQKATGTGHTTIVGIHRSQLQIVGDLKSFAVKGASGGAVVRHFCDNCGGRIYSSGTKPGEMFIIQAGSLDDPNVIEPTQAVYHKQAVRWDTFGPGVALFDTMPPLEGRVLDAISGNPTYLRDD